MDANFNLRLQHFVDHDKDLKHKQNAILHSPRINPKNIVKVDCMRNTWIVKKDQHKSNRTIIKEFINKLERTKSRMSEDILHTLEMIKDV